MEKKILNFADVEKHPYASNILTPEQAAIVAAEPFDNMYAPGYCPTEAENLRDERMYNELKAKLTGTTYKEAAKELWPDHIIDQLGYIITDLHSDEFEPYKEEPPATIAESNMVYIPVIMGNANSGNKLYIVTFVDREDSEDTKTETWGAKDDDELYDIVKENTVGQKADFDTEEDPIEQKFEEDWGLEILYESIGTIQ